MFGLSGRQLVWLLVLFVLAMAATQYIPGYYAAFQFNDFIRQEVKFAATARRTTENIRASILQEAGVLGIPLVNGDIKITRRGPAFTVDLEYRWPINMRFYQTELVFHVTESGEIFENASN